MKSNIVTRLIMDSENEKVYLSIEGKVTNASDEEKEELKNNLVEGFSKIIGIGQKGSKAEIVNDFIPTYEEVPEFVKEVEKEEAEKAEKETENASNEFGEELPIGFGRKFPKLTPSQIVAEKGKTGIEYLHWMIDKQVLEDRKAKGTETEESFKNKIHFVNKAIKDAEKGKPSTQENKPADDLKSDFDKKVDTIYKVMKEFGDGTQEAVDNLCKSHGLSLSELVKSNDIQLMDIIYEKLMILVEKARKTSKAS